MKLVLGAWGCGAYGNPVGEIARAWARVLCVRGGRNGGCRGEGEGWDGLEVVFAIKDCRMAVAFAREFGGGLTVHGISDDDEDEEISLECDGEA